MEAARVPRMVLLKDAIKLTGLNYKWFRREMEAGRITYVESGRHYFINLDKLIAYLNGEK